jgi:WD40 repeat protein
MTDHELEQRLRAWYQAEIPADEMAPAALRSSLRSIPVSAPAAWRSRTRGRAFTLLAAAALVSAVVGMAIVGSRLLNPPPPVPTAPTWTTTGSLSNTHVNHTATLLPDGRVLVTGAYDADGAPASAELYDPNTGVWTSTGNMTRGRAEHTATLLPNGLVLVAGGGDSGTARTNTAELYDPAAGTWTATGDMNVARSGHTATLLPDGRVLVSGSGGVDGVANGTAELYDPGTGTWTATVNMVTGHAYHTSTLLPDGTVLVAGGSDAGVTELFDPETGSWTATGSTIGDLFDATATLLLDGTVLVAGNGASDANAAQIYDPGMGTWAATPPMLHGHVARLTATLLVDGTVLVVGGDYGYDGDVEETAFADLYDPSNRTWIETASMNVARRSHTATLLPDGRVLVAGGIPDQAYRSAEIYVPAGAPPVHRPSPSPSLELSAEPTIGPGTGQILYTRWKTLRNGEDDCVTTSIICHRASIFISNDDGSGERELVPGPYSVLLATTPDGSKVLVSMRDEAGGPGDVRYLTDINGVTPQRLDTGCVAPCFDEFDFAFSPDGTQLAFVRTRIDDTSTIAMLDLGSGTVRELVSTLGSAAAPGWSPDGSRLVFDNHIVNADGTNLQQIAPADLFTGLFGEPGRGYSAAQWSPDGAFIAFASFNDTVTTDPPDNSQRLMDLYVVRPDGTGLQRLTTDTAEPLTTADPGEFGAAFPSWTRDGRIVFIRFPMPPETAYELWVTDADGGNATQLDPTDAAALTALGCVACPYDTLETLQLPPLARWVAAQ